MWQGLSIFLFFGGWRVIETVWHLVVLFSFPLPPHPPLLSIPLFALFVLVVCVCVFLRCVRVFLRW